MDVYHDWNFYWCVSSFNVMVSYSNTFSGLLLMGHAYMVLLVMLCQTLVYREVTALFLLAQSDKRDEVEGKDPWSKTLNWYFFAATNYFLYGESIIYYFKVRSASDNFVAKLTSRPPSACSLF